MKIPSQIKPLNVEIQSDREHKDSGLYSLRSADNDEKISPFDKDDELKRVFQQLSLPNLYDLLTNLVMPAGKKSFLVFKDNKYYNVLTKNIAFFYVRYESSVIMSFDKQEYFVNYSLDQIQNLLTEKQFFRLNRQYLINFNAIKEVEHYFARKLLVNPIVPTNEKLLVSKEKVRNFLNWLDDR